MKLFLALLGLFVYGCSGDIAAPPPPGPTWVVYTKGNSPLSDSIINSIHVDRHHRVWFATGNGVASFYSKSWSIFRDSLKYLTYDNVGIQYVASNVTSIAESKDGSIWFALKGGGIARFDQNSQNGRTWTRYKEPMIEFNIVNSVACDVSEASQFGEVWITSFLGIDRFIQNSADGGIWKNYGSLPFASSHNTVSSSNPFDNSIWIGTDADGLEQISYFPILTLSHVVLPAGYASRITGISFERNDNVWISKENGASVLNLESGIWSHYNENNTKGILPIGEIHAVESDLNSNRWFGTDSGLVHLRDTAWTRFTTANSPLPDNTVTSIKYDVRGNLWIGTRNGVAAYNPDGTRF